MPSSYRSLTREALSAQLAREQIGESAPGRETFGLCLEQLAFRGPAPLGRAALRDLLAPWAAGRGIELAATDGEDPPPAAARPRLAIGPGGQLAFQSGLWESVPDAFEACARSLDPLRSDLAALGVALVALGSDPWSDPEALAADDLADAAWQVQCEERVLAATSREHGRRLLRQGARARVQLSFGGPVRSALRWRAAQLVAPLLQALFSSSPFQDGASARCKSARLLAALACGRCALPEWPQGESIAASIEAYVDLGLRSRVLWVRMGERAVPQTADLPFQRWMDHGHAGLFPDLDDWREHLDALASPVRPRGVLEIEVGDAPPRAFWSVPLVLASALVTDDRLAQALVREHSDRGARSKERLAAAAREGLLDPELAAEARDAFARVAEGLLAGAGRGLPRELGAAFIQFGQRFALRGRSPADEWLELFLERGVFDLASVRRQEEEWLRAAEGALRG